MLVVWQLGLLSVVPDRLAAAHPKEDTGTGEDENGCSDPDTDAGFSAGTEAGRWVGFGGGGGGWACGRGGGSAVGGGC